MTLVMLDTMTWQALISFGKHNVLESFRQLINDHIDIIRLDSPSSTSAEIRIRRYVRKRSYKELDEMVSKPETSRYYQRMIQLRVNDYGVAQGKEKDHYAYHSEDSPFGFEENARAYLSDIVDKWRKLNEQVEYAAQRDRVEKHILLSLKRKVRNMEDDVADACYCINPEDQRLVHSDSTTNPAKMYESSNDPPSTGTGQTKAVAIFAFFVPAIPCLCFIPACFAWAHAEAKPGKTSDSDFFQLLSSAPIQLLGIGTALWPIIRDFRPGRAACIQAWVLALMGACFTIAAIPLYALVPTYWSAMLLFIGSFVQSLLQLQLVYRIPGPKSHKD